MISTRSVGLLIDTVVCLTLAKWETVSGRFGGYLRHVHRQNPVWYSMKAPTIANAAMLSSKPEAVVRP
jgi:hypothetical protein